MLEGKVQPDLDSMQVSSIDSAFFLKIPGKYAVNCFRTCLLTFALLRSKAS